MDEDERWAAIEDAPFNPRTGARQWTPDGAKRVVGQRVDRPVTVDEKVQAVADLNQGRRGRRPGRHRPAEAAGGHRTRHPSRKGPGRR
ncbi:DUF6192 family protein [Streptomyces sp. MMG1533]|uniref:DUF6192 family protein n=1 Tax=Streptomyces sp. MMG1533 TaxID=1415546 RepID=UPI00227736C2|nr:DUF6192 family protein [Streptomyces sp. MMG1533]